jgi:uncharacterized protein
MSTSFFTLPGYQNSGPLHWQSLWEQTYPGFTRIQQNDWDNPVCEEWVAAIETTVHQTGDDVVLVAHSLGCLALAHWASTPHSRIKAALLVAVPDCEGPSFPTAARGFSNTPLRAFEFSSTIIASEDDPYGSVNHSQRLAAAWGGRLVNIGRCGHINADSGLGHWPQGYQLLQQLLD